MTIWEHCSGQNHIKPIDTKAWRVVEAQNKSFSRKLVDTDEELDILEEVLEKNKPQIEDNNYHYLLFTPFRYPPLKYGSRFGRRIEPALWYGSLEVDTALREVAYYRLLFLRDTAASLELKLALSAFSVGAKSDKGIDLTDEPFNQFKQQISSPLSYRDSQPLGTVMRNYDVDLFLYYSARTKKPAINVGIFIPSVFKSKKLANVPELWSCYATKKVVEFWHMDKKGMEHKLICHRAEFSVAGNLDHATEFSDTIEFDEDIKDQ